MRSTKKIAVLALMVAGAVEPAAAVPPPPPEEEAGVLLPDDQCRVPLSGTVRGYRQPTFGFSVGEPTVIRLLADPPDPALILDVEHGAGAVDGRPVAAGVGVTGGDVRIALPAAGRYRLRVLMVGDAARAGRLIAFTIQLSRAMDSGAPPCREQSRR